MEINIFVSNKSNINDIKEDIEEKDKKIQICLW